MPSPGDATFLVRYGEIGIKSLPVRRRFERLLAENIVRAVRARGAEGQVRHTWGRLFLTAPEAAGREALARTFGVVSFSPVRAAPTDIDGLAALAAREAAAIPDGRTFAVRARRSGKTAYTSQDVARAVGAAVLAQHRGRGLTVDLDAPQAELVVEVRDDEAWVALESIAGPGGLPVASEGRVAAWLGEPRDAVAAWLVMKRGCRADLLAPAGAGAEALARRLAAWEPNVELTEVEADPRDRGLVLALLAGHARRRNGSAVVLGDGFDEAVALAALDRTVAVPVFRPLLALDAGVQEQVAARLGLALEKPAPPPRPAAADPADARARAAELLRGARRRKVGL